MSAHAKPTKAPARRVYADDLAVEIDGQVYHPHAGEWVEIRGGATMGFIADYMRIVALKDFEIMADEDKAALPSVIDRMIEHLAGRLAGWSWTNDAGTPMPAPTASVLRDLENEELFWLFAAAQQRRSEVEAKNA